MYEIFKDFAGPVATIIASVTAAGITFYFASRQARIAQQQADTAKQQTNTVLDPLRYNRFEKRYAVYSTAKDMITYIVNQGNTNDVDASFTIAQYFNALDEARF